MRRSNLNFSGWFVRRPVATFLLTLGSCPAVRRGQKRHPLSFSMKVGGFNGQ